MEIQKRVIQEWVVTLSDEELSVLALMREQWNSFRLTVEDKLEEHQLPSDIELGMILVDSIITYQDSGLQQKMLDKAQEIVDDHTSKHGEFTPQERDAAYQGLTNPAVGPIVYHDPVADAAYRDLVQDRGAGDQDPEEEARQRMDRHRRLSGAGSEAINFEEQ